MNIEGIGIIGANRRTFIIARELLLMGFQIRVYDSFKDSLNMLMAKIKWSLNTGSNQNLIENIEAVQDYSKFKGADLIIETSFKTYEERFLYFSKILKEAGNDSIIALNSAIPLMTSIERIGILPLERVIGFNFSEVFPFKIIEVSKTNYTDTFVLERVINFIDKLGVKYCVVNDKPGGVIERLSRVYVNSAFITLSKGKGFPWEIDGAIKEMTGTAYGPFEFLDSIGIDYDYNTSLTLYEMLKRNSLKPDEIELKLLQYGNLGRKSNLGIYIYEDGKIVGENPILSNIIKYLGLRSVSKEEIFSDIMIPVLNEAKDIAKELMVGEQDIENITKLNFGWSVGIFSLARKYPSLFVVKEKNEFDNLDSF